jgi:CubicO group peptidase (beta-lactamase class C family)
VIIAAAVMLLVQDGKLTLDDRAVSYLDAAPSGWNDITLRQLLSHTSGLVSEGPGYSALKERLFAATRIQAG